MKKQQLLETIHDYGFSHIIDVSFEKGLELVYSKDIDSDKFSWKFIDFEVVVFVSLFKGKIKQVLTQRG